MLHHKARLSDFVLAPIKVIVLAALPLAAGVEIGNRASAGDGITGATRPARDAMQMFDVSLASGYRALADTLEQAGQDPGSSSNDWADAQYFAVKATAAGRGDNDGPENTNSWALAPIDRAQIESARPRLIAAAAQMPEIARTANLIAAKALATAQVKFDCWIERAEEAAKGEGQTEDCHKAFQIALTEFDAAVGGQSIAAAIHPPRP